jgi:hypothetical protein
MRRQLGHALCIASLLALVACGGDDDSPSDASGGGSTVVDSSGSSSPDSIATADSLDSTAVESEPTADGSGSTAADGSGSTATTVAGSAATTVAGSATTAGPPATTIVPPSTNAIPENTDDLALVSDGLGPLRFGADSEGVVAAISVVLGDPTSDSPAEYPTPVDGGFESLDHELSFSDPFGRTVCWANGLCIELGGTTPGPYVFRGWFYSATGTDELAAPNGLDVGSRWADFVDVITVEPGGCFTVGYGSANGVSLSLQSSGTPFVTVDEDGTQTATTPDPADVVVQQMQAGEQVVFLLSDC